MQTKPALASRSRKKLLSVKKAAIFLGVSINTLRRWDKNGVLSSIRTSGKQRRYDIDELKLFLKNKDKSKKQTQTKNKATALKKRNSRQKRKLKAQIPFTEYQLEVTSQRSGSETLKEGLQELGNATKKVTQALSSIIFHSSRKNYHKTKYKAATIVAKTQYHSWKTQKKAQSGFIALNSAAINLNDQLEKDISKLFGVCLSCFVLGVKEDLRISNLILHKLFKAYMSYIRNLCLYFRLCEKILLHFLFASFILGLFVLFIGGLSLLASLLVSLKFVKRMSTFNTKPQSKRNSPRLSLAI